MSCRVPLASVEFLVNREVQALVTSPADSVMYTDAVALEIKREIFPAPGPMPEPGPPVLIVAAWKPTGYSFEGRTMGVTLGGKTADETWTWKSGQAESIDLHAN